MEFAQIWGKKYPAPLNAFPIAFEDRLIPAAN